MKAIVVGAGETGFHIAQSLSNQGHSIVVIDTQEETLEQVKNSLDVLAILGDGCSHRVLEEGGVKGSDFLAAVTNNDGVNIVASLLAKTYRVPRVVTRISGPQQLDNPLLLKETGLYTVYPEKVVADKIAQLIEVPFASLSEVFVKVKIRNPFREAKRAGIQMVLPEQWKTTPIIHKIRVEPLEERAVEFVITVPKELRVRRQPIAVDVTLGGHPLGQIAEALVTANWPEKTRWGGGAWG